MSTTWFDRLVKLIEASELDYKEISLRAGLGQNYVQQMVKNEKQPTVDRFLAIMSVLGPSRISYVLTGRESTEDDQKLIEAVAPLSPAAKEHALQFFQTLSASQERQEQPSGSRD